MSGNKPVPGPRPSKGGNRKIGRNEKKCAAYRLRNQREKNKARKLAKRLRGFSGKAGASAPAAPPGLC